MLFMEALYSCGQSLHQLLVECRYCAVDTTSCEYSLCNSFTTQFALLTAYSKTIANEFVYVYLSLIIITLIVCIIKCVCKIIHSIEILSPSYLVLSLRAFKGKANLCWVGPWEFRLKHSRNLPAANKTLRFPAQ